MDRLNNRVGRLLTTLLVEDDQQKAENAISIGNHFVQQYSQAGLKQKFPLYTACTVDNTTLRGIGDDAVGLIRSSFRSEDSDNPVNKRFVADFQKKYGRAAAEYAVQGYGAIMLIDSGVRAVQGRVEGRDAFAAPLKRADSKSVRGNFRLNTNGFSDSGLLSGPHREGGRSRARQTQGRRGKDHGDAQAAQCPLK